MSIYESDALFNEAYRLHTVEEDDPAAINLCRKALEIDPNHYRARFFWGILLSDLEGAQEKIEGRKHFVEAIRRAIPLSSVQLGLKKRLYNTSAYGNGVKGRNITHVSSSWWIFWPARMSFPMTTSVNFSTNWILILPQF